jgi:hypothetical protein
MPNPLVAAFVEGLRDTVPFRSLPVTNRPLEELWQAHNDTLLKLRLPLHFSRLGKPQPKQKAYDAAIQTGLAELSSFASVVGTNQVIVRIERGAPKAISFQPRPFAVNWVRPHGISPVALQTNWTDPLLTHDDFDGRITHTTAVSTRDVVHLAGKVALALARQVEHGTHPSGHATFIFNPRGEVPGGRIVYRPLLAGARHKYARTVELASS